MSSEAWNKSGKQQQIYQREVSPQMLGKPVKPSLRVGGKYCFMIKKMKKQES